jgi:acyl-CoA thioesterase-1
VPLARRALPCLLVLALAACGPRGATAPEPRSIPPDAAPGGPLVVFLGDSLTAGFGVAEPEAFPALVAERLRSRGRPVRVVNAGVSGDTSAGGLRRLDWVLGLEPDLLVVGLGANDGLRGQPPEALEANLRAILTRALERDVGVVLLGMRLPPNLGDEYVTAFEAVYPRLARELGVPLVPFLLDGVAARRSLNLEDGIHPNAAGHRLLAENVMPSVERALDDLER